MLDLALGSSQMAIKSICPIIKEAFSVEETYLSYIIDIKLFFKQEIWPKLREMQSLSMVFKSNFDYNYLYAGICGILDESPAKN